MTHDLKAEGGDQIRGAATPRLIAARTVETAPPENTGGPHDTTSNEQRVTSDPLWPLVVMLGDIAQRMCQPADRVRTPTSDVA